MELSTLYIWYFSFEQSRAGALCCMYKVTLLLHRVLKAPMGVTHFYLTAFLRMYGL